MTITIKRRFAGSYYVAENPEIVIFNPSVAHGEGRNAWIAEGMGEGDVFKTKRDAIEYAEWVYNLAKEGKE